MTKVVKLNGVDQYVQTTATISMHGIANLQSYLYDIDMIVYNGASTTVRLLGKYSEFTNYILIQEDKISIRYGATTVEHPLDFTYPIGKVFNLKIRRVPDTTYILFDDVIASTTSNTYYNTVEYSNDRLGYIGSLRETASWGFARFRFNTDPDGANAYGVDFNVADAASYSGDILLENSGVWGTTLYGVNTATDGSSWVDEIEKPFAIAGQEQAVTQGTEVTLQGSAVDTNSTGNITYQWVQTSGATVLLNNSDTANPTFTPTDIDTYTFELVVFDGIAYSTPESVDIGVPQYGGITRFGLNSFGEVIPTPASMPTSEEGAYFPRIIPATDVPDASFPDKYTYLCYLSPAHSNGTGGIYLMLCKGDPTLASDWIEYDEALVLGDFDYLATKPAGNPIYQDSVYGSQTETPYVNNVNGVLFMTYHNDGNISYEYSTQNTCLAKSTDGINYERFNVLANPRGVMLTYDPADVVGDGHTGYFRWGENPFSGVPFAYVGYSICGGNTWSKTAMWVSDDAENWSLHKVFGNLGGEITRTIPEVVDMVVLGRLEPNSITHIGDGVYKAIATAKIYDSNTQALKNARLGEVLIADDGYTVLSEFKQFYKGSAGDFDAGDIRSFSTFNHNAKTHVAYTGAIMVGEDIDNNVGIGEVTDVNGFMSLLKPFQAETTKVDLTQLSSLPANVEFYNPNGNCSYSFGTDGLSITVASGSNAGFYITDASDLSSSDVVDFHINDFNWVNALNCRPIIGLFNDVDNLSSYPKVGITLATTGSAFAEMFTTDSAGASSTQDTLTAIGYGSDYVNSGWESVTASMGLGVRVLPSKSKYYFLSTGKKEMESIESDFSIGTVQPLARFFNDSGASNTVNIKSFEYGNVEGYYLPPVQVADRYVEISGTGTPDGTYQADIYNDDTKTLITTMDIAFTSDYASTVLDVPNGTTVLIFIKGSNPPSTGIAYIGSATDGS